MNINYEITKLEKQISDICDYLSQNPYQNVEIRKERGRHHLYLYDQKTQTRKYISDDSPLSGTLLNVRYYKKLLPILESELRALQQFSSNYKPHAKYQLKEAIPEAFRDKINVFIKAPAEISAEWAAAPFNSNPYEFKDDMEFITNKGDRVRSKAEYIIANILSDMGLSYRYECEFKIEHKIIYPDFTIMHPQTGELYYLEYFGMMDDPDYMSAALRKISAYQRTDAANRCIYIFESQATPMNILSIKTLLHTTFLATENEY